MNKQPKIDLPWVILHHQEDFDGLSEEQIDEIQGDEISWLIRDRPEFFDKFTKEQIDKMDGWDIAGVLIDQPQLFDKFTKEQMDKICSEGGRAVLWLVEKRSQFEILFDKSGELTKNYEWARLCVLFSENPGRYRHLSEEERASVRNHIKERWRELLKKEKE